MNKKVVTYSLIAIVILLCFSLFARNSEIKKYREQMLKFSLENQEFKEEVDKQGKRIVEQQQVILSQKDAIAHGLLEIEELKKVQSQVSVVTNLVVDTFIVSHTDTIVQYVEGEAFLKLPQTYLHSSEFFSLDATINTNGLLVNNLTFPNETSVTIGYKREGLLKPLSPVVKLTHTNPYMQTKAVSNVIIEEKKNPLTDHKVWGGMGFLIGLLVN